MAYAPTPTHPFTRAHPRQMRPLAVRLLAFLKYRCASDVTETKPSPCFREATKRGEGQRDKERGRIHPLEFSINGGLMAVGQSCKVLQKTMLHTVICGRSSVSLFLFLAPSTSEFASQRFYCLNHQELLYPKHKLSSRTTFWGFTTSDEGLLTNSKRRDFNPFLLRQCLMFICVYTMQCLYFCLRIAM